MPRPLVFISLDKTSASKDESIFVPVIPQNPVSPMTQESLNPPLKVPQVLLPTDEVHNQSDNQQVHAHVHPKGWFFVDVSSWFRTRKVLLPYKNSVATHNKKEIR